MGKRFSCFASAFLIGMISFAHPEALASPAAGGAEETVNPSYRSAVSEVRLVFFATDEHNHSVEEVQKDDFAVVDNERVIYNFRGFARADLTKLDVVFLIDTSESVLPHKMPVGRAAPGYPSSPSSQMPAIRDALNTIAQWPWKPEDKISVLSFSGLEAHLLCNENCRDLPLSAQVADLPQGGATPLYDALEEATRLLARRRQPDVWPVIILFSDGEDTISKISFRDALQGLLASGVQVYAVDVSSSSRGSNGAATLQKLAEDSGGRYVRIAEDHSKVFSQLVEDLHSARVVTYLFPESNSDFHSVRIYPTRNLNLTFHSRRGYYHDSSTLGSEDRP